MMAPKTTLPSASFPFVELLRMALRLLARRLLRKEDERSRVVVEEVPPPDRGELPVAEEPHEGKVAELRLDQRDVVIRNAEEPAPATRAVEVAAERRPSAVEPRRHLCEHPAQILARRLRVADLELHGLAHSHALGDGEGTTG